MVLEGFREDAREELPERTEEERARWCGTTEGVREVEGREWREGWMLTVPRAMEVTSRPQRGALGMRYSERAEKLNSGSPPNVPDDGGGGAPAIGVGGEVRSSVMEPSGT